MTRIRGLDANQRLCARKRAFVQLGGVSVYGVFVSCARNLTWERPARKHDVIRTIRKIET